MEIIFKTYCLIRNLIAEKEERGEYSAGWLSGKIRDKAIDFLKNEKGKVLEVGCGEGLFRVKLLKINPYLFAYGVDSWSLILERCRKRAIKEGVIDRLKLEIGDGVSLPYKDNSFDFVVGINLIYNLKKEKAERLIKEMTRIVRKGGFVIFDWRNSDNPFVRIRYIFAPFYDKSLKQRKISLISYRRSEIESLLKKNSLKIFKEKAIGKIIPQAYVLVARKL